MEHARSIARELEGRAVYRVTSTDSRPVGLPPVRLADRRLRLGVGSRRGGLNGRRNAVKPFCHSRRNRTTGAIQRRTTTAGSPRRHLPFVMFDLFNLNNFTE